MRQSVISVFQYMYSMSDMPVHTHVDTTTA